MALAISLDDRQLLDTAALWTGSTRALVSVAPLEPGPWMDRASALETLAAGWQSLGGPPAPWHVRGWLVGRRAADPVLTPLAKLPHHPAALAFARPAHSFDLQTLWGWYRRQVREFWFHEADGWRRLDARRFLIQRVQRGVVRKGLDLLARFGSAIPGAFAERLASFAPRQCHGGADPNDLALWTRRIHEDNATLSRAEKGDGTANLTGPVPFFGTDRLPRVTHLLDSSREIEPAFVPLVQSQVRRGYFLEVLTDGAAEYLPAQMPGSLTAVGVEVRPTGNTVLTAEPRRQMEWTLLQALPWNIRTAAVPLAAELLMNWPDALHCWSDWSGVIGAAAGIAAGVPRILVDTRASAANPTVLSGLEPWLRLLAQSERVFVLAESAAGSSTPSAAFHLSCARLLVAGAGGLDAVYDRMFQAAGPPPRDLFCPEWLRRVRPMGPEKAAA